MRRILALLLAALLVTVGLTIAGIDMKMWRMGEASYRYVPVGMQPVSLYRQSYIETISHVETLVWLQVNGQRQYQLRREQ